MVVHVENFHGPIPQHNGSPFSKSSTAEQVAMDTMHSLGIEDNTVVNVSRMGKKRR